MAISKAVETEIVSALFFSAAEQMRRTLVRTAFNAVIHEVLDFGISIADAKGRMVARRRPASPPSSAATTMR